MNQLNFMAEDTRKIQLKKIRTLGIYGVIRQSEVDDYVIPDGAVTEALNVHFDRKGATTLRLGTTAIGSQISTGKPCLGLYNALFAESSKNCLLSVFAVGGENIIYKSTGSAWISSLTGDTVNLTTHFATFGDRVIRVNGTDAMKCFDGSSWTTTGNPINPQDAPLSKYIEVFKARVYLAGHSTYPDRLYYSDIVSSSGNLSWTTSNYIDVDPNDGENITALKRYSLELLVFKPNYIYRYKTTGGDPDPLIKVGTYSQESVCEGKKGIYFHHWTGFYLYDGAIPKEISKPISDFVAAIPLTSYSSISSWRDDDHIYWSIGDLTVNGKTWSNTVVRYTESSEVWAIYGYPYEFRWGCDYNNGTSLSPVVGDDNGYVYNFNSGYNDNGTMISYYFITKWYELGNIYDRKHIQELVAVCEKAQGGELMYQIDEEENNWQTLGSLKHFLTYFKALSIRVHRIRFKLTGTSRIAPFVFLGMEFSKMINEGSIE